MSRRRKHEKNSAVFRDQDVWTCCGRYYANSVRTCPACGRARVDNPSHWRGNTESQCSGEMALVKKIATEKALPRASRKFVVAIERHGRRLDGDNFIGGAKQLRDAIADALGLPGDSEEDGVFFEYKQVPSSEKRTIIRIKAIEEGEIR